MLFYVQLFGMLPFCIPWIPQCNLEDGGGSREEGASDLAGELGLAGELAGELEEGGGGRIVALSN